MDLVVDATHFGAVAVVEAGISVDEGECGPAIHGAEKAVPREILDGGRQLGQQRVWRVVVVVEMQLDLAKSVDGQLAEVPEDQRARLLAGIEERVLRRTSDAVLVPRRQRAVAACPVGHAGGVVVGLEMIGEQDEEVNR